jgi:hypothetical protein
MRSAEPIRVRPSAYLGWMLGLLLALLARSGLAQGPAFSASLDRDTIGVGETATLSLTFQGGTPTQVPALQLPPGLTAQSAGQSRQITLDNGEMRSNISFNYTLTASRPGEYVIPSITGEMDHQTYRSVPLKLKVTASAPALSAAFLKLIPSKEMVYVGEVFPVEVQLYLAVREDNLQLPQIEGDGFVFGKVPQPTQSNSQVGNQMFQVVTFRLSAMAVKEGTLTLGPAQCSLVLYVPIGGRSRTLFDDFFGGGVQRRPVTLSSEAQKIVVVPLPKEEQPASFNGAVGRFSLAATASPTNVIVGDPITLHLKITGQGNLESLPFPGDSDWADFKLYPPTSKIESTDSIGVTGAKSFERVVIPQSADVKHLPGVTFSFFDPEQKAYRTLDTPPIPIVVRPSQAIRSLPPFSGPSRSASENSTLVRDVVHIKPYLGPVIEGLQPPLLLQPWFLALQGVPLVAWFTALLWRRRQDELANNPQRRRQVRVSGIVRQGLRELTSAAQANDSEKFFATAFRLLQEQLGERLNLPGSAITEAVLDERLRGIAPEELVSQLHELFQLCNQARYAPQRSPQELMQLVPKVETALHDLRQVREAAAG